MKCLECGYEMMYDRDDEVFYCPICSVKLIEPQMLENVDEE